MIKPHKDLAQPVDSDIIWHYYSLPQFLYLLENSCLHFTRADKFEDKWEVLITEKDAKYFHINPENIAQVREREAKRTFINCWTIARHELALMWKSYSSVKDGIVIRSTVGNLKNCYSGHDTIYIAPVQYIDETTDSSQPAGRTLNALWFSVTKRNVFIQENELRLVYHSQSDLDGYELPIDCKTLIQGIGIAPNAEPWFISLIKKLLHKYDIEEHMVSISEL